MDETKLDLLSEYHCLFTRSMFIWFSMQHTHEHIALNYFCFIFLFLRK